MSKITDRTVLANPSLNDIMHVVDVSDTTDSPAGTSKQISLQVLGALFSTNKTVLINSLTDFPAPIGGIITLAADTKYLIGDDVNLGTNRLVMAANTVVSGIESLVVTLTYTGTGDMFTMVNTRNRISMLSIVASTGRVLNFSDNTDTIFRMNDCSIVCDRFGLFNSSGPNGSTVRFTAVSPSTIATDGATITGDWNSWLWETSALNIINGNVFNFGTATFSSIILDLILSNLAAGTSLINGLASSGNIKVGGIGNATRMLTSGLGAPLVGVTVDDTRWVFKNNEVIPDTQPDAMVSLTGNTTETVIGTIGLPVKVAGTWVVERASLFTGDTSGRITYDGERPLTTPVDIVTTVKSVSGNNKDISVYLAVNGVIVANSAQTTRVSSTDPRSVSVIWQLVLNETDFLEVFVANDSDLVNLMVSSAIMRAR